MWRFYAAVALVWLVLSPPLFTNGACSAEFDAENERLARDGKQLVNAEAAERYFQSRGVPVSLITLDQCRRVKPRFLARCGSGPLVYAEVAVQNKVCRFYRDNAIKVQLRYGERGRWAGMDTDMAPFKSLPIPFTSKAIDWGR
jgi:hypothetical protein